MSLPHTTCEKSAARLPRLQTPVTGTMQCGVTKPQLGYRKKHKGPSKVGKISDPRHKSCEVSSLCHKCRVPVCSDQTVINCMELLRNQGWKRQKKRKAWTVTRWMLTLFYCFWVLSSSFSNFQNVKKVKSKKIFHTLNQTPGFLTTGSDYVRLWPWTVKTEQKFYLSIF